MRRGFFKSLAGLLGVPVLPEAVEEVRRYRPEEGDTIVVRLSPEHTISDVEYNETIRSVAQAFPDCRVLILDGVAEIGVWRPGTYPPPPPSPISQGERDRWWRETLKSIETPRPGTLPNQRHLSGRNDDAG